MSPGAGVPLPEVAWWWWIVLSLAAAGAQTARNAMQKGLTGTLGTVGATLVRFVFGLPFAAVSLLGVLWITGAALPAGSSAFFAWVAFGGLAQIAATALMLAAMRQRSFVVATAYVKTEAIQVAVFGLVFLGETLSATAVAAVVAATTGVLLMSWPKSLSRPPGAAAGGKPGVSWQPVLMGLLAGSFFAASAVGFKGAIVTVGTGAGGSGSFVMDATFTLVCGLLMQTVLLIAWQGIRDRQVLIAMLRAWRPSLLAGLMGALASQMWFLAFAIATTAHVRTLALVEILFAHALSRRLFSQHSTRVELVGIALVVSGAILLING
ncbi:MAG: EamA/RhaT family transporter [Lautropia sp.]|nr:EamA/RhaT family transporter [Lautropia sp.]